MEKSVKVLKTLKGEFVTAEVVKEATQKEYNQREWNKLVDRYSTYSEVKFFKTPGTIYDFNYYVIYVADGIRFLIEVSYGGCLSNGGYSFGFFTEGLKDKEQFEKIVSQYPDMVGIDKDTLTFLSYNEGRIADSLSNRVQMREETKSVVTRFYSKVF